MKSGSIVYVDWRDRHHPPEPGKYGRPAVVISDLPALPARLGILAVIPLTGDARLAPFPLHVPIEPTPENGLTKRSFALPWNVQTIAMQRVVSETAAMVTSAQVAAIKRRIVEYLEL